MKNLQCKDKQKLMNNSQSKEFRKLDTTELKKVIGGQVVIAIIAI